MRLDEQLQLAGIGSVSHIQAAWYRALLHRLVGIDVVCAPLITFSMGYPPEKCGSSAACSN